MTDIKFNKDRALPGSEYHKAWLQLVATAGLNSDDVAIGPQYCGPQIYNDGLNNILVCDTYDRDEHGHQILDGDHPRLATTHTRIYLTEAMLTAGPHLEDLKDPTGG